MQVNKETRVREVVTKTEVEEEVFVLELSREEANALQAVVGRISGSCKTDNLRDTTNAIYHALDDAGIDWFKEPVQKYNRHINQSLVVGN